MNNSKIVYDIPTRIFHWLLASSFTLSFIIAQLTDDESKFFLLHIFFGLFLLVPLFFRIIWGFVGTKHSRFSDFNLSLKNLILYLQDQINLKSKNKTYSGHNPASSWAAVILLISIIGIITTGILMVGTSQKENFEEIHELFVYLFLCVSILHVTGVVFHTIKYKDPIGISMITGKKLVPQSESQIRQYPFIAALLICLSIYWGFLIYHHYDSERNALILGDMIWKLSGKESED